MEHDYWIGRKRAAMAMAKGAAGAEARLIHLHLAGCYSVKAVRARTVQLRAEPPSAPGGLDRREPVPAWRGDER